MADHRSWRRVLGLLLTVAMLMGLALPAAAAGSDGEKGLTITKIDNSAVKVPFGGREADTSLADQEEKHEDTEVVRVSIALEEPSTLGMGFSTHGISANNDAMAYRESLRQGQLAVANTIKDTVLGGKKLDVVWNLTLAANVISANVEYGKIEAIRAVPGVKSVTLEKRYDPMVYSTDEADPNMATSSSMIGSGIAYAEGYTGAGSRVAIIDTGTDTDHRSFDAEAFDHAIDEVRASGKAVNLLTKEEVAEKLDQLNIVAGKYGVAGNGQITADDLYLSTKLPFAYNYVDEDTDVTHDNDTATEHGSHVAGIAAANRYVKNAEGNFVKALDEVHTQGVAPDAQIITMKVFGKGGGAYTNDYMAAIEDAIILDCDAANLSLGSSNPGESAIEAQFQEAIDLVIHSGLNLVISAGNAGSWADNTYWGVQGYPYLYTADVSWDTVGSPGSYTHSLAVASVDNVGSTGQFIEAAGVQSVFAESTGYSNAPIGSLDTSGSGTEYDYIFFNDPSNMFAVDGEGNNLLMDYADVIEGKVVFVSRGTSSFYQKHDAAAEAGAIACIVCNNQPGVINMDLSSSTATIPCVSILQEDAAAIEAASTAGSGYVTGKIIIHSTAGSSMSESEFYTMSDFSSFGVPGSLELKPEITAPGGNIYSVNGAIPGGEAYENMSGTSMAAPQISGMMAVLGQYIREKGLESDTLSARQLSQSLLMSTAEPMVEDYGDYGAGYYSVFRQGAGLANVGAAINAHSYILMDENATLDPESALDGKVKAELGDGFAGNYTFSFTLHNLTDAEASYDLSADVFTQDVAAPVTATDFLGDTWTTPLEATTTFTVNGTAAESVTLPAGGVATVEVTIDAKDALDEVMDSYPNGCYVEAYVYAAENTGSEGVEGTVHSIPVLGFYGVWSEASMYEVGSYMEYAYGMTSLPPYLYQVAANSPAYTNFVTVKYAGDSGEYYFGGNPMATRTVDDGAYNPARNAFNNTNGDKLGSYYYTNIRNAGDAMLLYWGIEGGHTVIYGAQKLGAVTGAFYYDNGQVWQSVQHSAALNWTGTKADGTAIDEGTTVCVSLVLAPEYYLGEVQDSEGNTVPGYDWDALLNDLGAGAWLDTQMTIDNTAPTIDQTATKIDETAKTLTVAAQDNQYISAIVIYNADGTRVLDQICPDQDAANTKYTSDPIDMSEAYGTKFLVAVYDYARNQSTYEVTATASMDGTDLSGKLMGFDLASHNWFTYEESTQKPLVATPRQSTAATFADGYVFTSDTDGKLYVADEANVDVQTFVADLEMDYRGQTLPLSQLGAMVTDLTYYNNNLYGVVGSVYVIKIDPADGSCTTLGYVPVPTASTTIAADGAGNFYSVELGTGAVYKYTESDITDENLGTKVGNTGVLNSGLQSLVYDTEDNTLYWAAFLSADTFDCDINGDGVTDEDDVQIVLDHLDGEAVVPSDYIPYVFGDAELDGDGFISTYDAHLMLKALGTNGKATLYAVSPTDGTANVVTPLAGQTSGLMIPTAGPFSPSWAAGTTPTGITLSQSELSLLKGAAATLTATVAPWSATNKGVTWSSGNTAVATVNQSGVVTAVSEGSATITATSAADSSVTATCAVTVTTLNTTLVGAYQDVKGNPFFFEWDLTKPFSSEECNAGTLNTSIESATLDLNTGDVYVMDAVEDTWALHKVDSSTGEDTARYANTAGVPFWDMAWDYSSTETDPTLSAVYAYYFLAGQTPSALNTMCFGAEGNLNEVGANFFTAIASNGPSQVPDEDTGEMIDCEEYLLLDDAGNLWIWEVYPTESGLSAMLGMVETDLTGLDFPGDNNLTDMYCSLVVGTEGNLYLSYFTGSTNEIYFLEPVLDGEGLLESFHATRIGDIGQDVWPMALLGAVEENGGESGASLANLTAGLSMKTMEAQEVNLSELTLEPSREGKTLHRTETLIAGGETAEMRALSSTAQPTSVSGEGESGEIRVKVNGDGATNGLSVIEYQTNILTYVGYENVSGVCAGAYSPAEGVVNVAWAAADGVGGSTVELIFSYDQRTAPGSTKIVETVFEKSDETFYGAEYGEEEPVSTEYNVTLSTGTGEIEPPTPGVPSGPSQPSKPDDKPTEPDDKPTEGYDDVDYDAWYGDAVTYVTEKGIMQGGDGNNFHPFVEASRAMVVTTLYRMADSPATTGANGFTDVQSGDWYANAVLWGSEQGIVLGADASRFLPNENVTREQLALFLYRMAGMLGYDTEVKGDLSTFTDGAATSDWASEGMAWAVGVGLLEGNGGKLRPTAPVTRAELANVLMRYLEKK